MDDQDGPPWARKYQGITLPWDCSLAEVDESMSTVGFIIYKSLQRIAQTPRKHVSPQIVDKAIELKAAENILVDMQDLMRKMMVTITSDPTPDSLMPALDSAFAAINYGDIGPGDYSLQHNVVLHISWPTRTSSSLSRARSRSF
mmetsp:Transcript_18732/g.48962  ORF Transcript_18732/g.48962 Transcript_18732/m.48962 type:complete len:144 (-) Transcript_18732:84-515(-)